MPVVDRDAVVGFAAPFCGKVETIAEFHALHGADAEQQVRQPALHRIKEGFAHSGRHADNRTFQNPAHRIALGLSLFDPLLDRRPR